jgi:hypothetical protein
MFAWWMRLNTIIAFAMLVLFICLTVNWITSFWLRSVHPQVSLKVSDAQTSLLRTGDLRVDIWLDIEGDLSALFNWNTKQVFVYCGMSSFFFFFPSCFSS